MLFFLLSIKFFRCVTIQILMISSISIIIGERINPTGKKKLQEKLREGSFDLVISYAEEQEEHGADILDVNMGMSGIDEMSMMLEVNPGLSSPVMRNNISSSIYIGYVLVLGTKVAQTERNTK